MKTSFFYAILGVLLLPFITRATGIVEYNNARSACLTQCAGQINNLQCVQKCPPVRYECPDGTLITQGEACVTDATTQSTRKAPFKVIPEWKKCPSSQATHEIEFTDSTGALISATAHGGDKIEVSQNNETDVRVKLEGFATMVNLGGASVFILPCDDGAAYLEGGLAEFLHGTGTGPEPTVHVKNAISGIKGTQFIVDARDDSASQFILRNGALYITPTDTALRPFELAAGQKVSVFANSVSTIAPLSPSDEVLFKLSETAPANPASATNTSFSPVILGTVVAVIVVLLAVAFHFRTKTA